MKRASNFIFGALIGGIIGAVLALLFTPKPGAELRQDIVDYANQVQTEIKQAAISKRQEMEAQLASLRQPKSGT